MTAHDHRDRGPLLLIEDDLVDQLIVKRACRDLQVTNRIEVAASGEVALRRLHDPEREEPCLILLDLHMPRLSGRELLQILRHDPELEQIPVVVMSSFGPDLEGEVREELGVAGCLAKAVDYGAFVDAMRALGGYWSSGEATP